MMYQKKIEGQGRAVAMAVAFVLLLPFVLMWVSDFFASMGTQIPPSP